MARSHGRLVTANGAPLDRDPSELADEIAAARAALPAKPF
jgi:hypothetical protein